MVAKFHRFWLKNEYAMHESVPSEMKNEKSVHLYPLVHSHNFPICLLYFRMAITPKLLEIHVSS